MSILGDIISSVFGSPAKAETAAPTSEASKAPEAVQKANIDVASKLDALAKSSEDKDIDWRRSIVDLMKILKLDSSLSARKQLAKELHYTGDTKNSAEMNTWLHKQVMSKLVENGGVLPSDVLHG